MNKSLHYVIYNGLSIFIRAQKNSRIAVFNGLALEYFLSPHSLLFFGTIFGLGKGRVQKIKMEI